MKRRKDQTGSAALEGGRGDNALDRLSWNAAGNLFGNAPIGIYIVQDRCFRYVSRRFLEESGYREDEVLGRDPLSLVFPDDRETVGRNAVRMLKGESLAPYEYRFVARNGDVNWILETVVSTTYAGKRAAMGYFMNITGRKEAEAALRAAEVKAASEARCRMALDSLMEGCQIIDHNWRYVYVNDVAVGHSRKGREELVGRTMMDAYPGIESTDMFARLRDCMERRHPHRMENLFTYHDGSQGWFELLMEPVPEGVFVLSVDITERKRLALREARLVQVIKLVRNINQLIIQADDEAELLQRACDQIVAGRDYRMAWIGFTREGSFEIVPAAHAGFEEGYLSSIRVTWDDSEYGQGATGTAIRTGKPAVVRDVSSDPRYQPWRAELLKRGCQSCVALPLTVEGVVGAIHVYSAQADAFDDEELGLLCELVGDISLGMQNIRRREKGKQQEKAIRRAAEEWRTTFDSVSDLLSVHGTDFRISRVNRAFAQFFDGEPQELLGKTCYELFHETMEPCRECPFRQTIASRKPATEEFFEPHLDRYIQVTTSPILDDSGEVVGCVHTVRDISQRKRMEAQLMVTDRLASVGELASGVAHELNNPLTSIIGFSDLLARRADIPQDIREDVDLINREARRTAQIVQNLLTFARKHEAAREPVDIPPTVNAILSLRAYQHRVNNIEAVTRFAPDLPQVIGDSFQLQQVFMNLIINAEHFMIEAHKRGRLSITGEKAGDAVRLSFADDGPGIPRENLRRIFTPFFTTKEAGKGTGLGLSICHGIVSEHGGRIYAESEPGQGAIFIVELPARDGDTVHG